MKHTLKLISIGIVVVAFTAMSFFLWWHPSEADLETIWGVNYSESQAEYLGLDQEEAYSAIIHDLGAKNIKLHINWNAIEKTKGSLDFERLDRQIEEAQENNVQLILVIGLKTGRWPECHTPDWFIQIPEDKRQEELLHYISQIVERYKDSPAVQYWQIENEPLLKFGICPAWYYKQGTELLKVEVATVKALDPSRKIIISDSGELSTWTGVAEIGDIVGITMYRSSWNPTQRTFGINPYSFLAPEFYSVKARFIQKTFGKPVIGIELQAEPWASKPLAEASLAEQARSMNPELFDENVIFAKETGLSAFYFWGAEWWYWMKVKHEKPEIWDKARQLFAQ